MPKIQAFGHFIERAPLIFFVVGFETPLFHLKIKLVFFRFEYYDNIGLLCYDW